MRFANAHRYYVMACAVMLGGLAIAAESISITSTPRYPWNGKVDLKFAIDGTSGTKYDTSFTAKDVTGGTNLTMKTLYKSNGTAANVAKEQLLPGTYNWVWDAMADLGEGMVLDKVVVEGKTAAPNIYMVVDLKTGTKTYLSAVPDGGWTDDHRKTLMVFRRVNKGTNSAGGSMTKDMWVGIFEVTLGQHKTLMGAYSMNEGWYNNVPHDDTFPSVSTVWCNDSYGNKKVAATTKGGASLTSPEGIYAPCPKFFSSFASKSGLKGVRLPTWPEWQFACRAGTGTSYHNETSNASGLAKVGRYSGNVNDGKGGFSGNATRVGSYQPNSWGIYDMHGNIYEMTSYASHDANYGIYYGYRAGGSYQNSASDCTASSVGQVRLGNLGYMGYRVFIQID